MVIALHILFQLTVIARVLLRPHRDPTSRVARIVVILVLPVAGMIGYLLLAETSIGRRRLARIRCALAALPDASGVTAGAPSPEIPERHRHLFLIGRGISDYTPLGGSARGGLPRAGG